MSGIYWIRNKYNDYCYVGSSADIKKRWRGHQNQLGKNRHHNIYLQRAWNKCGANAFLFAVILLCPVSSLLAQEQIAMQWLQPEYNIAKYAEAPMMGRKHSIKTRKKMRASSPRVNGKRHHRYGKKLSDEHIHKIITSRKWYTHHSKITKAKMRATAIRLKVHMRMEGAKLRAVEDSDGYCFSSLTECALFHEIHIATVCDILHGRHNKTRNVITFKYV